MKIMKVIALIVISGGLSSFAFAQDTYHDYYDADNPSYDYRSSVSHDYTAGQNRNPAVDIFYQTLAPYGRWIMHSTYGLVFAPRGVGTLWRPYTDGHWKYTEYGWAWVSDEPWGWAVFHYGRWFYDDAYGWVWYPDSVWAPAWVAWRYSDDFIGWAPLPPEAHWDPRYGFNFTYARFEELIPPEDFYFVEIRYFIVVPLIRFHFVGLDRHTIIHKTKFYADYKNKYDKAANYLPVEKKIEQVTGIVVKPGKTIEIRSPEEERKIRKGPDDVIIVNPRLKESRKSSGAGTLREKIEVETERRGRQSERPPEPRGEIIRQPQMEKTQRQILEQKVIVPQIGTPEQILRIDGSGRSGPIRGEKESIRAGAPKRFERSPEIRKEQNGIEKGGGQETIEIRGGLEQDKHRTRGFQEEGRSNRRFRRSRDLTPAAAPQTIP